MKNSLTKNLLFSVLILSIVSLSGCTISKDYGPYKGKVIDAETNEPIEGAVIFVRFYTIFQLSPGGSVHKFADAVEVLTDKNGDFNIPTYKVNAFRLFSAWDSYEGVIIFKPGYGAFPKHPDSNSDSTRGKNLLEENSKVTVKLPKPKTTEERKLNIATLDILMPNIPYEKQKIILSLSNIENKRLGLEPLGIVDEKGVLRQD